jgi:hypothetical protein
VLEEWKAVESENSQMVEVLDPVKALEKSFFGFSCWSADQAKVVFMHKDLVKMPRRWLND